MVEYRKNLTTRFKKSILALTNLAVFVMAVLAVLKGKEYIKKQGWSKPRPMAPPVAVPTPSFLSKIHESGASLMIILFLVTTSVIHWWKHREKYKKLTKVKALMGIVAKGGINLAFSAIFLIIGWLVAYGPNRPEELFYGGAIISMFGVGYSGVISDSIWQGLMSRNVNNW
jgi:hypothetical protein